MNRHFAHLAVGVLAASFFSIFANIASADPIPTVLAGYNLFQTGGAGYPGLGTLTGVPLGTYDFGGSIGVQYTGSADTILQRLQDATPDSLPSSPQLVVIVLDALQLETLTPVDYNGDGLDNYFVTLDNSQYGTMSITFTDANDGYFSSNMLEYYDVRKGSLSGPIVDTESANFGAPGSTWSSTAPSDALLINGVNNLLDNADTNSDFWPPDSLEIDSYSQYNIATAVPEPTSLSLLAIAGIGLLRRRRSSHAEKTA